MSHHGGAGRANPSSDLKAVILARAGRLLLESNESTGAIHRTLSATAGVLTDERCAIVVSYEGVVVSFGGEASAIEPCRHIHSDTSRLADVHSILDRIRRGELDPGSALEQLERVEDEAHRHPRWVSVGMIGLAAASLCLLLGPDVGTAATAGLSSSLGVAIRGALSRRGVSMFVPPLVAALIGAILGGLSYRLGWARIPGLAVIVPSLMLVPGTHLINGLLDLIDDHMPMCLARFGLAAGLVLACATGVVLGMELTIPGLSAEGPGVGAGHLNLVSDMMLAGVVTCGFAISFNSNRAQIARAVLGGMAGHGLRFATLGAGSSQGGATFLGALAVGAVAAMVVRPRTSPIAAVAFAGAVTMMPGLQIYKAIGGTLRLARLGSEAGVSEVASTVGNAAQAGIAIGAIALGLIAGARAVRAILGLNSTRREHPPSGPSPPGSPREAQPGRAES